LATSRVKFLAFGAATAMSVVDFEKLKLNNITMLTGAFAAKGSKHFRP